MNKVMILFASLLMVTGFSFGQTTWNIDASHSNIGFTATHMVISEVAGTFNDFDAKVVSSKADFSDASIEFSAKINSIDTDNEKRDGHLQSADFFDAEQFPTLSFKSTSFEKTGDNTYALKGNLTMKGVTKEVTLNVKHGGVIKDPWGNTKAGFKVTGVLDRFDYGLTWNTALETGGLVVGKEIQIICNIELSKAAS